MNWILGLVIDNTCVGKQRRKEDFTKSDLWTKCYSFINSQERKKDLSIYNAFKSRRRKTEMNSTHLLLGLSLRKK